LNCVVAHRFALVDEGCYAVAKKLVDGKRDVGSGRK